LKREASKKKDRSNEVEQEKKLQADHKDKKKRGPQRKLPGGNLNLGEGASISILGLRTPFHGEMRCRGGSLEEGVK